MQAGVKLEKICEHDQQVGLQPSRQVDSTWTTSNKSKNVKHSWTSRYYW